MNKKISLQEISSIFYARQYAYDILRRFLIEEPSREYLKSFVQNNMIQLFPFSDESPEIKAGAEDIIQYLFHHDLVNNLTHFENLHWDYTRMLIGPFELPVPPWESVYVRKDKLLFQENTMQVRQIYERFGYIVKDFNLEADDHIGLELDFMFRLNELCIEASDRDDSSSIDEVRYLLKEQKKFLDTHLLAFAPALCQNMINSADTQFFIGVAKLLKHFLVMDSKVLTELMNIEFIEDYVSREEFYDVRSIEENRRI